MKSTSDLWGDNMSVEFQDFTIKVKAKMSDLVAQALEEAGGEMEAQVKRNQTRVKTGQTKGGWTHRVDRNKGQVVIGNPLENAIWEEFGTGEYATNGGGRKTPWAYKDERGEWHTTRGKKPLHALQKAFDANRNKVTKALENRLKGLN